MRPDLEMEVDDLEYAQLKADGLLFEPASETPAPATADPAIPAKKNSGVAGSKES
jgi:hypothetical protein